jgi:hypothetical protein
MQKNRFAAGLGAAVLAGEVDRAHTNASGFLAQLIVMTGSGTVSFG